MASQPQDAILPELILHGLSVGCSSPSTAPTIGPYHRAHPSGLHGFPWITAPPVLLANYGLLSAGCSSIPGPAPVGALCEPLLLQPHPLLPHGFLHDCMWRFALHDAHGLQGYSLLHCGPLLSFRELLLHLWTTSCPPSALTLMAAGLFLSHFSLSSPSCCCPAVFPFLKSALPEHTQHHSWLMSGSGRSLLEQLELALF